MQVRDAPGRSPSFVIAVVLVVVIAAGLVLNYYSQSNPGSPARTNSESSFSTTSSTVQSIATTSSTTSSSNLTTIIPNGTTFQVQSSFDCLAGHYNQSFTVTSNVSLLGVFSSQEEGVMVYLATAEQAQTLYQGHPSTHINSWAANSVISANLGPGTYVLWVEGADSGCNATVVEPLEMLTTVTVTHVVALYPPPGPYA